MSQDNLISKPEMKHVLAQENLPSSVVTRSWLGIGNRITYQLCGLVVIIDTIQGNGDLLVGMSVVTFLTVVLPKHPFDLIYSSIASFANLPLLSRQTPQLKFAWSMVTIWLSATAYFFNNGFTEIGTVLGTSVIIITIIICLMDYCIPSLLFNEFKNNAY